MTHKLKHYKMLPWGSVQLGPANPFVQLHLKLPHGKSIHVPPLKQGKL